MVFPLGDSPEEASKRLIGGDKLGWFLKNENVYEYIKKPQSKYAKSCYGDMYI